MTKRTIRRTMAVCLVCLLSAVAGSCLRKGMVPAAPVPAPLVRAPGLGLSAAASAVVDPAAVQALFSRDLLEYGIVPVQVTVRNDDVVPLALHAGDLSGAASFGSIRLRAKTAHRPVHPAAIVSYVRGEPSADAYRTLGMGDYVAGTLLGPLGGFYLYREFTIGRYMRPLLKRSLLPPGEHGLFASLVLEPGESATGFLYVVLPEDESPFRTVERTIERDGRTKTRVGREFVPEKAAGWELVVRPAAAPEAVVASGTAYRDACFFEAEGGAAAALLDSVSSRESRVLVASAGDVAAGAARGVELGRVRSRAASIAGAAAGAGWTAVAVNTRASARVFVRDADGAAVTASIDRPVAALVAAPGGPLAIATNGFAWPVDPATGDAARRTKVARSVQCAAATAAGLLVVAPTEVTLFSLDEGGVGNTIAGRALKSIDRRPAGLLGGDLVIVHDGRGLAGDTLVVIGGGDAAERGRLVLPGRIAAAGSDGRRLLVCFETGLLAEIVAGEGGAPVVSRTGRLPAPPAAIRPLGDRFVCRTGDGYIVFRTVDAARPRPHLGPAGVAVETRALVTFVEAAPETEER